MTRHPLALAALLSACAAPPRPTPLTPTAAAAAAPARDDDALIADLTREANVFVHPSAGPIGTALPERAQARLAALSPADRPALARALLAWLVARAWGMDAATPAIRAALSALGDEGYDTVAARCDAAQAPYGCTSLMLYSDAAGHEALLARLLARLRAAVDAGRGGALSDATLSRAATLCGLLLALDRPEPVHRALLSVAADDEAPARLRVEVITRMNRTDLPFVEPALDAIARAPTQGSVRETAVRTLAAMVDHAPTERVAALYDTTPAGGEGASLRGVIGEALVQRLGDGARPRLRAWMRREGALRAGYDEADRWAHALASRRELAATDPGLRDATPEGRALALLAWSWVGGDDRAVRALADDRAALRGPGWREHEVETVGALARWAVAHAARDPSIRLRGCCHEH